jgi:formyl-CoA transferase/CoA:oxalate CoA-transferase
MLAEERGGPLAGMTVLDLTRVLSGPYCTMLLGDMGARVLKIEQPGRGDDTRAWGPPFLEGESAYYLSINRNKESITVDFKKPEGVQIVRELIARADVVVENFRPGTLAKFGLGYDALAAAHPRMIYCSISGFGQNGPRRTEPGYDAVVQAEGGLMSITGPENGTPYRMGVAIADLVTGMFAMQGILLALLARERTGRGQFVDIAMLDSAAALLTYQASIYFTTGQPQLRMGNRHPSIAPYDTFPASDGDFVLAVGNDAQFRAFCTLIDRPALADDDRFATNAARVAHAALLRAAIEPILRSRSRRAWIETFTAAGVPAGAVRDVGEVLRDPQLLERAMIETLPHPTAGLIRQLGLPVKLSNTPGAIWRPPPLLGEHTRAVLQEVLGYDERRIEHLAREGVV